MNQNEIKKLHNSVIVLFELCVLEDKLQRIQSNLASDVLKLVIQDLEIKRQWSTSEHCNWLAFEVEGALQIRNEQYTIAKHLIDNPGSISQLNMGMGKTRVILPMIIMFYCQNFSKLHSGQYRIPRIFILRELLSEAVEYLHLHLTSSSLNILLLQTSFHRAVPIPRIDDQNALSPKPFNLMHLIFKTSLDQGCFQVLAPEHFQSMGLKYVEDHGDKPFSNSLQSLLSDVSYIDILDESDSILWHKKQLIYTVGNYATLESLFSRVIISQAILRILNNGRENGLDDLLGSPGFAMMSHKLPKRQYRQIRLSDDLSTDKNKELNQRLRERIALEFCKMETDDELSWIKEWTTESPERQKAFIQTVINCEIDPKDALKEYLHELSEIREDSYMMLLALRGYLSYGILEKVLQMRYRVNYGIDSKRKKRIAVPFTAADIPSARSEFSNPDMTLFLTVISYYNNGLSKNQIMDAFKILLDLGADAQMYYYSKWLGQIASDLSPAELSQIDQVIKLDITNMEQMELLCTEFKFATEVINFWLNRAVFPMDMTVYPKRITSNAWNLASGKHVIGFSGTKDKCRLMPTTIKQNEPDCSSLISTDGKMVHCLIEKTIRCDVLHAEDIIFVWKSVLDYAISEKVEAIIDAGSLLAGVSNLKAAHYLVSHQRLDSKFQAIVYYDTCAQSWFVYDRQTRLRVKKEESSIKERDSLILFDDARTRGSDMKMKEDAIALLTIGPDLAKDKVMQAAGRMRGLDRNQKLIIVMTQEVCKNIQQGSSQDKAVDVKDIVEWLLKNTCHQTLKGFPTFANQFKEFTQAQASFDNHFLNEKMELVDHYETPKKAHSLFDASSAVLDSVEKSEDKTEILERIQTYGLDYTIELSVSDDQCEREAQIEIEKEPEREVQAAPVDPIEDTVWNYAGIINCMKISDLSDYVQIDHLSEGLMGDARSISWKTTNIYGTKNFFQTITKTPRHPFYMRLVEAFLVFPNSDILLLSDKEADKILQLFWERSVTHLEFCQLKVMNHLNDITSMTALKLLNGETRFPVEKQKKSLRRLLPTTKSRSAIKKWVEEVRLNFRNWDHSHLKKVCSSWLKEA